MEKVRVSCCNRFQVKCVEHLKLERALRKGDVDSIPKDIHSELICNICINVLHEEPLPQFYHCLLQRTRSFPYFCTDCIAEEVRGIGRMNIFLFFSFFFSIFENSFLNLFFSHTVMSHKTFLHIIHLRSCLAMTIVMFSSDDII